MDYHEFFPELHGYLIKPLLVNPPMCKLSDLKDGTYTIYDLEMMHQIIQVKEHMKPSAGVSIKDPTLSGVY